ncbi:hypothetical protein ACQ4J5_003418 [Vibrio cholerae]
MKKYLSLLMVITLSIALLGCNGSSGSSDSSSELAESYDGVYKDKNGESLFYSSNEDAIYLYRPPQQYKDGYISSSNRSIVVDNSLIGPYIDTNHFVKSELGDYYHYQNSTVQFHFSKGNVSALVKDEGGRTLVDTTYTKLPTLADFDLMYQSYADWELMTLIFSNDDRMFAQLDFMVTCQLNADVKKVSNFYRVSNGAITCNDPNDPRIDSNMHGVIYKVAEDSQAIVIVQGKRWTYRTTFQTVY